ncbi:3-phosphoserine/phosphohydroxythreonine transaminase [bacterium SCSIO 12643]|nr:3-phosphoserine/phosphohydroxythreonine transaminase [bacterium SCSIO 12643]
MSKVHNYSAGPCILPQEVLKQASEAVTNFDNLNLSILEISHRSPSYVKVMDNAIAMVKEMLNVPDNYSILFLQGGASTGFLMTIYNLLKEGGSAAYADTGTWSSKAIKEAQRFGDIHIVASSKDKNYNYIPKGFEIPSNADYFHFTSNNTIYGTQYKEFPQFDGIKVCDMSSDIFSRQINVADFDLIYAGAQKNLGPAGATLYIVKDDIFNHSGRNIPAMMDFKTHASKDSMFNTPPVYSVYVAMLNLQHMLKNGGLSYYEKLAQDRADMLYHEIDSNPLFEGTAAKEDRSNMNATFVLTDESYKDQFDQLWNGANISGIKGHRSVGGYRASMYNALPLESVEVLVNVMKKLNS